ncbi:hypothetical protein Pmani_030747 [Petrolisthes manimaculis]|uniref:Uncharacterized protein n=1 Tax=Petrolisthes manimaculis TaxID=1843537 RepID=A0AAE1TT63_9EUCA|nr:hypothetical protein Pmani_030747 [Petrolisthes manimaculis]
MRRQEQVLSVTGESTRVLLLVLVLLYYCSLPTSALIASGTFKKFLADTSLEQFTKCPPAKVPANPNNDYNRMFHCVSSCLRYPPCNFVTFEDGECRIHSVNVAPEYTDQGTNAVGAYRKDSLTSPGRIISQNATISTTSDFPDSPTFADTLLVGGLWCANYIDDCPCTLNRYDQRVQVNLGAPLAIKTIILYRVPNPYEHLSYNFKMHIGTTGNETVDPLFIHDVTDYGGLPFKTYEVNQVAQYITFLNYLTANFCSCKLVIYGPE